MNTKSQRGEIATGTILLICAVLGVGGWFVSKTKWFHGESKRAETSKTATAKVETATAKVDAAADAQGSSAAAGVAVIGRANAEAPDSPSKNFIAQEVPAVLAKLPSPDPVALLEAEKRRSAVMEGRVAEARELYAAEAKRAATLQQERDTAIAERNAAMEFRRQADAALAEAAAVHRADEQRQVILTIVAALAAAAWGYSRLFGVSLGNVGRMAADIRSGVPPIHAIDTYLAPWHHATVQKAAKLAADIVPHPSEAATRTNETTS